MSTSVCVCLKKGCLFPYLKTSQFYVNLYDVYEFLDDTTFILPLNTLSFIDYIDIRNYKQTLYTIYVMMYISQEWFFFFFWEFGFRLVRRSSLL